MFSHTYKTVAASQTGAALAGNGKTGNIIHRLIIIPANTSPGAVSIADGNGTDVVVFAGGATSVADLKPFSIEIGAVAVNTTTPGWKVTTGADVSIIAVGKFT